MNQMTVIYAQEPIPKYITKSLFLAGTTPRAEYQDENPSWRKKALQILSMMGYDGVVFVPEARNGVWGEELLYAAQIEWEEKCLNVADIILFWIPRDMKKLPGLTTNDEWGVWKKSGKVVLGFPLEAEKTKYQHHYAKKYKVPTFHNLYIAISECVKLLGEGSLRQDGEVNVPMEIWKNGSFQQWYKQLKQNGNRLDDAKVLWIHRIGSGAIFCFSLWVKVWIESEKRYKDNEFVLSRPDISACVLYYREAGSNIEDTQFLMVKEFRSPVNNSEGFVCEIPGGSTIKEGMDNISIMLDEVSEETGMRFTKDRVQELGGKQIYATLLSHKAHVYSIALNQFEAEMIKSKKGETSGNIDETEITYPQMITLREALYSSNVDWANIGMLLLSIIK